MDLSHLIAEDAAGGTFRVHRSVMVSPEIFALEQQRIFDRSWLYVGHESEVPRIGDYRRRTVAERPLFMVRGRDGQIRVFLNTCPHRGALVCRQDDGNADTFQCFYHGWTFNGFGELIGVPDRAGYCTGFDRAGRSLATPPNVESYRGMYFVNFAAGVPSLADYLGPEVRKLIDLTMDSAEILGGWEIIDGTAKYDVRANWKLMVENSIDGYHLPTVHQTYLAYMAQRHKLAGAARMNVERLNQASRGMAFTNGHAGISTCFPGRPIANPSPLWSERASGEVKRLRERLVERFGVDRGHAMCDTSRLLVIFPNLAFQDTNTGFRLRQWWPKGPDRMELTQWELVPRQEDPEVRAYRLEGSLAFLGPGGLATPDDVEALESCQIGFRARELEWSDMSRGMHRLARSDDELQMRGFWRQWHALIQGRAGADRTTDLPFGKPAADAVDEVA